MSAYLPDYQVVFIYVPRTGGHYVHYVLDKLGVKVETPRLKSKTKSGAHWRIEDIHPDVEVKWSFGFVRDPYYWLRTAHHYSMGPAEVEKDVLHYVNQLPYIRFKDPEDRPPLFDWIKMVYEWQPAFVTRVFEWYLGPANGQLVDFIGRTENLDAHLRFIFERVGLPEPEVIPRPPSIHSDPDNLLEIKDFVKKREAPWYRRFSEYPPCVFGLRDGVSEKIVL